MNDKKCKAAQFIMEYQIEYNKIKDWGEDTKNDYSRYVYSN